MTDEPAVEPKVKKGRRRMAQPLGLYARDLLYRADEYVAANAKLDVNVHKQFLYVGFFLLAHAVELGLKAFLAAGGTTKKELKAANHDLAGLYATTKAKGLPKVTDFHHLVRHLVHMNSKPDFGLRYPAWRMQSVPDPAACLATTQAFLEAIRQPVETAATMDFVGHVLGKGDVDWTD